MPASPSGFTPALGPLSWTPASLSAYSAEVSAFVPIPVVFGYPTYMVEIAFTDTTNGGFWQLDISHLDTTALLGGMYATQVLAPVPGVRSIQITRGRTAENAQISTGMCTVVMDNAAGNLSPDNPNSPYWPNVVTGRLIRVSMIYNGIVYRLFTGWIEAISPTDNGEMDSDATIVAHDFLGKATRALLNTTFPAQDEGARINTCMSMLNDASFPRVLDAGLEAVLPVSYSTDVGQGTAPPALVTLTASGSGSALAAGTYNVVYTEVYSTGKESLPSTASAITILAGQQIIATLPAAPTGVSTRNMYMSLTPNATLLGFSTNVGGTIATLASLPAALALPPPVAQATLYSVQQHINDVLTAERGIFYQAADGSYHYENRHYRFGHARSSTPQAYFGQPNLATGRMPSGYLPYTSLDYVFDDATIFNDIHVRASNTTELEQVATDVPSTLLHDTKTLSVQSQVMGIGQAQGLANWLLAGYKDQRSRVNALTLDGDASDQSGSATDMWVVIGKAEISDRIHIEKSRPGSMGISRDLWIEGIQHDIKVDLGGHTVKWALGDVTAYGPAPWVLDVSQLDISAIPTAY